LTTIARRQQDEIAEKIGRDPPRLTLGSPRAESWNFASEPLESARACIGRRLGL